MFASGFVEPLFYLLSIGIGLNHLVGSLTVGSHRVSYAAFVAPGMLATSAMNGAVIDSVFNPFFRLKISHAYDSILATPLDVDDIALGEALWALTRAGLYAVSFVGCMFLLGDTSSPWAILEIVGALATSFAFSALGLAACTYLRSWQDFDLITLVSLPLFLFSATFFPLSLYPRALATVVAFSPLYQSATLLRGLNSGQFDGWMILRLGYLVALGLVGLAVAARRFRRILSP
jgi:lipooligosaccharide transport system permease protein